MNQKMLCDMGAPPRTPTWGYIQFMSYVMKYDPQQHNRRTIRWEGYAYSQSGGYFITICALHKRCVFGAIKNGVVRLNDYGQIVAREWQRTAELRAEVELDEFVLMPNHFHAIVLINVGARGGAPSNSNAPDSVNKNIFTEIGRTAVRPYNAPSHNLGATINGFKGSVTRRINAYRDERQLSHVSVWQRNYYESVIRDENELNAIRQYIIENSLNWASDGYAPQNQS
jgi:REP element-mobilizing transposase RayT